jgi:tryptophan-rich sensory protein
MSCYMNKSKRVTATKYNLVFFHIRLLTEFLVTQIMVQGGQPLRATCCFFILDYVLNVLFQIKGKRAPVTTYSLVFFSY